MAKHYCPDWDFDLIDDTDPEIECCTCDRGKFNGKEINKSNEEDQLVSIQGLISTKFLERTS